MSSGERRDGAHHSAKSAEEVREGSAEATSDDALNPFFHGIRNDWTKDEIANIYNQPFHDLMYKAATVHRKFFAPAGLIFGCLTFVFLVGKCRLRN
jgi:hypothetical protein